MLRRLVGFGILSLVCIPLANAEGGAFAASTSVVGLVAYLEVKLNLL